MIFVARIENVGDLIPRARAGVVDVLAYGHVVAQQVMAISEQQVGSAIRHAAGVAAAAAFTTCIACVPATIAATTAETLRSLLPGSEMPEPGDS